MSRVREDRLTHPRGAARHGVQTGSQMDFVPDLDPPFSGPSTGINLGGPRKLSHFRKAGAGDPMWSGSCIYGLSGASPSFSQYDADDPLSDAFDDEMPYHVRAGVATERELIPPDEYTLTRKARVSAVQNSAPAARTFQGAFNPHWSGLMAGFRPQIQPRPLVQSFNPNQAGSKELHPSTQYKPFPPMGSIVPQYGEAKAL